MIKAVLFDYGGVLSPGGKSFKAAAAQILDVKPEEIQTDNVGSQLWDGEVDSEEFFKVLSQRHGKTITADEFLVQSHITDRNEEVYELAKDLRKHGIKTGMLSNMYKSSADVLRASGHYDDFDPIVLSYEATMSKPNPAFYGHAIEKLGVKANEILFIDDQERFLPPAEALGMHTIKADSEQQIIADTKALILKENGLKL